MLMKLQRKTLAGCLAALLTSVGAVAMAADVQPSTDLGPASASQTLHVTLMLKLRHEPALANYIRETVTPGSAHFHQFLNTAQFAERYGATDAQIAQVQAFLAKNGLQGHVLANHLAVETTGTAAQFGNAFKTPIHEYVSRRSGRRFHRPAVAPQVPRAIASVVDFAAGLSNERQFRSHRLQAPQLPASSASHTTLKTLARSVNPNGNPTATGQPGDYTVGDVADMYNINPLYKKGITGQGATVGVVTLSNFYPADAQAYWDAIGLTTKPNRITQVHVDGGGAIDGGSGETSLDVEQSGGLAPQANIIVYDAPNSGNGFIDALTQTVADNKADSISISWGSPEIYNFAALSVDGASDTDTTDAGDLKAFHAVLLEAAVQGQSVFAATGDSGAYDTVRGLGTTQFNAPLTVDSPASDPYITAAGGTTTPFTFSFGTGPTATISQESVWGWDYLETYLDANAPIKGGWHSQLFSTGGGGGVSVYWRQPFYQWLTLGTRRSERGQALVYNDPKAGPTTLLKLPANFAGRNVPDIALNADPETGYVSIATTDGGVTSGNGGTSFVAPQLNGIDALLTQSTGHRIGLWNPQVYFLQAVFGYGPWSAFSAVRGGDNWFYHGGPRYTPGAGLGSLNVANLNLFLGGR